MGQTEKAHRSELNLNAMEIKVYDWAKVAALSACCATMCPVMYQ